MNRWVLFWLMTFTFGCVQHVLFVSGAASEEHARPGAHWVTFFAVIMATRAWTPKNLIVVVRDRRGPQYCEVE